MAKKKKGKGKGDKAKKKDDLTNRERETFLLTISELEHKIAWRNHLCGIIEEDLNLYAEKLEIQRNDKREAVNILEVAIEEQRRLSEKIQRALPEAENSKILAEERQSRELASKLMKINEEKISYDAELDILRRKLKSLESYKPEQIDEKIKDITDKLMKADDVEGILLKELELDKRRSEAFRKEMQDILEKEAEGFQNEISGKLDEKFERITEETRWWADTVCGLKAETERLEAVNDLALQNIKCRKMELNQRKNASLKERKSLLEREGMILQLLRRNMELQNSKKSIAEFQDHLVLLDGISEDLSDILHAKEDHLMSSFKKMQEKENTIKILEEKLANEERFGKQLNSFIERAQKLLFEEAKSSLIVLYNGPPEKKKIIKDLGDLFEVATKFIYERKDSSVL